MGGKRIKPIDEKSNYPLEELAKHVGKEIEVCYVNSDFLRKERGILVFPPNGRFFYIGKDKKSYHIIHWDNTDFKDKRNAVVCIRNITGNEIYRNNEIRENQYSPL